MPSARSTWFLDNTVRREIAKRGRAGDVFVPDKLVSKLRRFWRFKKKRGESLEPDGRDESTLGAVESVQRLGGLLRFYRSAAA